MPNRCCHTHATQVTRDDLKGSVRWGTSASALTHTAAATTATYTVEDMCTAPANTTEGFLDPGTLNTAVMTGLPYSRRIYYQVGSGTGATLSPVLVRVSRQGNGAVMQCAVGTLLRARRRCPHSQPRPDP